MLALFWSFFLLFFIPFTIVTFLHVLCPAGNIPVDMQTLRLKLSCELLHDMHTFLPLLSAQDMDLNLFLTFTFWFWVFCMTFLITFNWYIYECHYPSTSWLESKSLWFLSAICEEEIMYVVKFIVVNVCWLLLTALIGIVKWCPVYGTGQHLFVFWKLIWSSKKVDKHRCACKHACLHIHVCKHSHNDIHLHVCMCTNIHSNGLCKHVYVHTHICMHAHAPPYTYINTHMHTCEHTEMINTKIRLFLSSFSEQNACVLGSAVLVIQKVNGVHKCS